MLIFGWLGGVLIGRLGGDGLGPVAAAAGVVAGGIFGHVLDRMLGSRPEEMGARE